MIIGITGNIGSGKSTVASIFAEKGATIIEGDSLGHEIVDVFPEYRTWLTSRFGSGIWNPDGSLNRGELGRLAFSNRTSRDDLNRRSWEFIQQLLSARIRAVRKQGGIPVVDAAMIYEWRDEDRYDAVVAVIVDPEVGAKRAAERLGHSVEEMMDRYRMQVPAEEKASRSHHVIRNDGSLEDLRKNAEKIWTRLTSRR